MSSCMRSGILKSLAIKPGVCLTKSYLMMPKVRRVVVRTSKSSSLSTSSETYLAAGIVVV